MLISVAAAAKQIRDGGVAAFPTETVYGLGASAFHQNAIRWVYRIKGRPRTSPLIVHVDSIEMAREQVAAVWPPLAEQLAQRWWPGPLTLVLPKRPHIPDIVTAGLPTVGIRVPKHPVALELIRKVGMPIAAPSANPFMGVSPTSALHVERALRGLVGVVDGGDCEIGIESAVVAIRGDQATLLRPGMITLGDLKQSEAALGAHPAPGMHPRHYSPKTRLLLVEGPADLPESDGAYLYLATPGESRHTLEMPSSPDAYGAQLYRILHELDQEGLSWIAVEEPPVGPEWIAIRDRLRRAAGPKD